jgi:type IV pilus assembly protein PilX
MKKGELGSYYRQHGAVLVVGLLIMILMTLIGATAMRTTTLEEKMAGNMHDRNLSFQAAETALREVEQNFIEGLVNIQSFDGSNGLYGEDDPEPTTLHDSSTWGAKTRETSGSLSSVTTKPRYMVKVAHIKSLEREGGLNIEGYGASKPGSEIVIFRVTARGTGGTNQSQVVLRSYYGKTF